VRILLLIVLAAATVAAAATAAAPTPRYTVTFTGAGTEHQVDHQQNIQDDGTCDSAEHVDVTAALAWSARWTGLRAAGRSTLGASPASSTAGSHLAGSHVKDACGLPIEQAPPGWASQETCDVDLVASGPADLSLVSRSKKALVLGLTAPPLAVPPGSGCSLNVRNDQLVAHVVVPLKKLGALKKGRSLKLALGTATPGPGDLYAPSLDCSQPTKPYEGYRTADHCQDDLSWSGTLLLTRAS
jgi:hypothetical protein